MDAIPLIIALSKYSKINIAIESYYFYISYIHTYIHVLVEMDAMYRPEIR